jgi:triacylglycerol lipase
MNLFNAAVVDRPGVRYSSIITAAPKPPWNYKPRKLITAPPRAALAGVFSILYHLAAREHRHYPYPHPGQDVLKGWSHRIPFPLDAKANDGIVPSLSQVYGRVLDVAIADHLDVVGQFETEGLYSDWLPSGSNYREAEFLATWDAVAAEIAAASRGEGAEIPDRDATVTVQSAARTRAGPADVEPG